MNELDIAKEARLTYEIFRLHRLPLESFTSSKKSDLEKSGQWEARIEDAKKTLQRWARPGVEPAYTPETLAQRTLEREAANQYQSANLGALYNSECQHLAQIMLLVQSSGLAAKMIEEGKEGKKLGIVEVCARLSPALTFDDASNFFEGGLIPYGRDFRTAIGENVGANFVSMQTAMESATNLIRKFGVHYALAETSAAPRRDVPKSGKKPSVCICSARQMGPIVHEEHTIDVLLRSEFNCVVRELMFNALKSMYL